MDTNGTQGTRDRDAARRITASRWAAAVLWMALIFRMSMLSGSDVPSGLAPVGHLGAYAVLGALIAFAALRTSRPADALLAGVVIASLYGITDEIHQAFVPGRMPDVVDWLVDIAGSALGAGVLVWASTRWPRRGTAPRDVRRTSAGDDT